ncbi:phosphoglycolate phosphatase [Thalassolituus sp. LLYu03]|uniref:phosphoglycolate phosphatase n=1 Tax=Thalassolituus sp. LLYu03 TaxID=3421656 RepID=UPI003D293B9B
MVQWNAALRGHFGDEGPLLVLLDLDGTLIDSVPDLASAVDQMLAALQRPPAGRTKVSHWIGNGADMLVRRALCDGDEAAANALAAADVQPARALFDTAYLDALHHATGAFAGVEDWLARVDVPKVLITNKPRLFTVPLIESLGWSGHFVQLLCGDDLKEKKPSPAPLFHACEIQNVPPALTLMVGDSRHDIGAAQAAGVACAAVTYGYNHGDDVQDSAPDWVISNLLELLEPA